MNILIGALMVMGGIVFGIWAGLWWAFIGGIVDIVNEINAASMDAKTVAFGVVKIVGAGFIGMISALLLIVPGIAVAGGKVRSRRVSVFK